MKFKHLYNNLNPEQKLAVDTIDGPVLVIAGPGTGKTQLLSMRVANIIAKTDTLPQNILCLTFTDSASLNMKKRLRSILGKEANKVEVFTFHALGTELINQNSEYFFNGLDFSPVDDLSRNLTLEEIFSNLDFDDPLSSYHPDHGWTYLKDTLNRITDLKQGGFTPEDFQQYLKELEKDIKIIDPIFTNFFGSKSRIDRFNLEEIARFIEGLEISLKHLDSQFSKSISKELDFLKDCLVSEKKPSKPLKFFRDKLVKYDSKKVFHLIDFFNLDKYNSLSRVYFEYQTKLSEKKLFDFDDMLLSVIEALSKNSDLRFNYQEKFQYILVDEFQDTNGAQMKLLSLLINNEVNEERPNIMVVGDDDQSIFKFQKATLENILDFEKTYKDPKIITLTKNYRSTQDILDYSIEVASQITQRLTDIQNLDKKLISQSSL